MNRSYFPGGPHVMMSGPSRSGKDSIVSHLVQYYGYHRLAHADAVREACAAALGISLHQFEASPKDIQRPILQAVGHNARYFSSDIWIEKLAAQATILAGAHEGEDHPFRLAVSDCRYPNEVAWGRAHDLVVIRIIRERSDIIQQMLEDNPQANTQECATQLDHPVECILDDCADFDRVFPSERGHLAELIGRVVISLQLRPSPEGQLALVAMNEREARGLPPF